MSDGELGHGLEDFGEFVVPLGKLVVPLGKLVVPYGKLLVPFGESAAADVDFESEVIQARGDLTEPDIELSFGVAMHEGHQLQRLR